MTARELVAVKKKLGAIAAALAKLAERIPDEGATPKPRKARLWLSPSEQETADRLLSKLGEWNHVKYTVGQPTEAHRTIASRLREGFSEGDLRMVIRYCAHPKGLGWAKDTRMVHYLRPQTLFGAEAIERYLDPAKSWFERHGAL